MLLQGKMLYFFGDQNLPAKNARGRKDQDNHG